MDFGMKLQSLRKEKGLSQEALAEKLNVSRQAVSKWESGAGYPEMDKLILLSDLFQVSLDYLIKDSDEPLQKQGDQKQFLNSQKIKDYMVYKNQYAMRIGLSVSAIILSVLFPICLDKTDYKELGIIGMLTVVGLAVAVLIITGMSSEAYDELEKQEMNMSFNDLQAIQEKYTKFKSSYGISIGVAVFMIILSVAVGGIVEMVFNNEDVAGMILIAVVSVSVFIFIYQGIKDDMYCFLAQNKKYVAKQKKDEKSLYAMTMPLAAMAYLFMGLTNGWWHPGWIIFPVVAIITRTIENMMNKS